MRFSAWVNALCERQIANAQPSPRTCLKDTRNGDEPISLPAAGAELLRDFGWVIHCRSDPAIAALRLYQPRHQSGGRAVFAVRLAGRQYFQHTDRPTAAGARRIGPPDRF